MDTLLAAPMGFLHYLYYTAVQEAKTDAGKAEKQREALEDAMEGGGGNDARRIPHGYVLRPKANAGQ